MLNNKNKLLIAAALVITILMIAGLTMVYFFTGTNKKNTKDTTVITKPVESTKESKIETDVQPNPAYKGTAQNQPPAGMPEFTPPPSN